jgi:hypothetical protein
LKRIRSDKHTTETHHQHPFIVMYCARIAAECILGGARNVVTFADHIEMVYCIRSAYFVDAPFDRTISPFVSSIDRSITVSMFIEY